MIVSVMSPAFAAQRVVFNLSGEPKTLDPHLATGVLESHVINQMYEGLIRTDEKGLAVPGMANRWDVSSDGTSYTFYLRTAKWSNGEAVTAHDFVYGWRRCLNPATAAEYAYQLYHIQGAEEYNRGKGTAESIAVAAESDSVLTVKLKHPAPYFPALTGHFAYFPLNEKWVAAHADWASDPAGFLGNGAFKLTDWRHRDRIILQKNGQYYDAGLVKLDEIEMTMVANESTALMQWETGKFDIITQVPLPDVPRLKAARQLQVTPYLGVYYVALNQGQKPFNDTRVRKAFSLAIDRAQITKAILRGGQQEAYGVVSPGIELPGIGDYRKTTGDLFKQDVAEAKKLLAAAGYPNGRGLPPVKYTYNDLEMHRTVGEALQRMWLENLGVRVTLQVQEYKVYIQTLHSKNFQMARAGWIADFANPAAFLDMFMSSAGNNSFNYNSPEFDGLLAKSRQATDIKTQTALLQQAEKKLIRDDMVVAPIYFYTNQFLQKPHVKGVIWNPLGNVDFREAYVEGR